jgi:hypothetical protein
MLLVFEAVINAILAIEKRGNLDTGKIVTPALRYQGFARALPFQFLLDHFR